MASDTRVCALDGCSNSLEGMAAGATFCSRVHKGMARRRRRAAAAKEAAREAERAALEAEQAAAKQAAEREARRRAGVLHPVHDREPNRIVSMDDLVAYGQELDARARERDHAAGYVKPSYRPRRPPLAPGVVI